MMEILGWLRTRTEERQLGLQCDVEVLVELLHPGMTCVAYSIALRAVVVVSDLEKMNL